ncbi:MAG: insulinase family protein [Phycisphaerales bacterium]|nr:insulinase family protein [Phycisphaerales bacterium]
MLKHLGLVAVLILAACLSAVRARAQDLMQDPAIVSGKLDNGLRYMVMKHANPPGRAVVWIHLDTGSLNETERQRGIAHYLEHMAFNGSENFPPGTVVPFFQSLGMQFGRDQNAFTSFEQTTYQLSLPDAKPETLGKGMLFFADVLSRLSLLPTEIDEERQIIQEERRRGLSGRQRTSFYVIERMAPGSIFGQRITIGTEETINGVNEADFKDYYGKWYAASNATVMVVADTDPEEVVKVIKDRFGSAPAKPRPVPQDVGIKPYEKSFAIVASDPEVRSEQVRITRLEKARPPVTTEALYRDELVARLATQAMNRRLVDKVSRGGTSYLGGNVSTGNDSGVLYTAELSGRAAPGKWKEALNELSLELQRARAFGFTARELDDVKKQVISGAERSVETWATQPAGGLIGAMNSSIASGDTILSPEQRLALLKKLLPTITVEEVSARFATEFDPKTVCFTAVLPSGGDVPTEAQLVELGTKALAVEPTREAEIARAAQLMPELPKPGTLKESEEHSPSQVWSGWLGNNTRVHYRYMDYRKNQVTVRISLIGGELLETAENRGITQAAQLAWSQAATRHLTSSDIRDLMTGKKISVRGGGGFGGGRGGRGGGGGGGGASDSISLSISGSPDELETGMQLAYLLLTEPRIEPASFTQFQAGLRQALLETMSNPSSMGARIAGAAPYPEDVARTRPVTIEQVDKLTVEAAQAWLEKLIKDSPIEVSIVGDISKDKALDLVVKYLGAVPARERVSPATMADLRKLRRPAGPRVIEKSVQTPTPQAFVMSGFYGADDTDRADVRALGMAARIISTRMVKEVREDAQLVYSIGASSRAATTYPGFGMFSASAPTDPSKVTALVAKLESMYAAFAKSGPTDEELDVAKKQMANTLDEQMKDPGFWSGRIDQMTFRKTDLDEVLNEPEAYQSLTAAQIRETFAKFYSKDNSVVVVVRPEAMPTAGTAGPAGN